MVRALLSALVLLGGAPSAHALFSQCPTPSSPLCVLEDVSFQSDGAFEDCRMEIVFYIQDMEDHVGCLERQIEDANVDAEFWIEKFNCQAEGGSRC
ncbi:MAG: hypothetical protein AAGH60_13950 [Pseudomonadota bacterium]